MNQEVEKYINKQFSPQKEILKKLHVIITKNFPTWEEGFFGGSITYGADDKNKFGKAYLVGLKDHVNFGVNIKGLSNDILEKLDKVGKITGSIEIKSLNEINQNEILKILKAIK